MAPLVLVGGSIAASYRNGGIAWERLSWILGLRRLGVRVLVVDQLDERRCVNLPGQAPGYDGCLNVEYCRSVVERFGLADDIAVIGDHGESLLGRSYEELLELAGEAEMLVNVAGNVRLVEVKLRVRRSVYVDVDPGFTQLWLASGRPAPRIAGHDLHFTIGENVGTPASPLPTAGLRWRHVRQPVLLDEWPVAPDGDVGRLTTIASWSGGGPHGSLAAIGHRFTQKADEFLKLVELPGHVPQSLEVVLRTRPGEEYARGLLTSHGWTVAGPEVVADPDAFRRYVQSSGGELSVAKGAYVATRSGWFSDRTVRYLASGRPAIAQDTGFGSHLPLGEGLLSFSTLEQAIASVRSVAEDYERHQRAARRIAEEYFDSDRVLGRFVEEVLAAA